MTGLVYACLEGVLPTVLTRRKGGVRSCPTLLYASERSLMTKKSVGAEEETVSLRSMRDYRGMKWVSIMSVTCNCSVKLISHS